MYCLKCGQETEGGQAFCLSCQKEMAKYPVNPNTAVQLPRREQVQPKKPAKRRVTPEDQIRILRRRVRIYACLFLAALLAAVCLSIPLIRDYGKTKFQIGQNYTTVKPGTAPTEASAGPE